MDLLFGLKRNADDKTHRIPKIVKIKFLADFIISVLPSGKMFQFVCNLICGKWICHGTIVFLFAMLIHRLHHTKWKPIQEVPLRWLTAESRSVFRWKIAEAR